MEGALMLPEAELQRLAKREKVALGIVLARQD